jgi:CDP-diacylglycerol--glycerol-3-phosphate 3-phosphatidyltransferase
LPPRTLTSRLGALLKPALDSLVRALAHVSADVLTMTGLALTAVAGALFATAGGPQYVNPWMLRVGGVVALVASVFDMLDGRVARLRGRGTQFGAYLDSTMDRYSDMLLYLGLLVLYARLGRTDLMVLVWMAAFGGFMTSYARARAESLIPRCPVGLLERPERVVLVIAGAILNRMVAVLWIVAILSNVTAIQRVVYTYVELKRGWSTFFTSPDGRDEEMGKDE